ncbi:hypothetical protein QP938_11590 [Porticoccaceae bacterium LTM1]|nr:hypothetical protein QP938_11590 [Porticoccaceae bacterium LTM1]
MTIFELTAVLNYHQIKNLVSDGRVLALRSNAGWIDVTEWSRLQMARWLG